jgi:transcriptional regulator with PAS, ATPase and Fis domain
LENTGELQAPSLPDFQIEARLQKNQPVQVVQDESLDEALARIERELITSALDQNNSSLTRAAERLKLTRHSLRYRMQRLNMGTDEASIE